MSDTELAYRATLDGSGFANGIQNMNAQINDLGFKTGAATANLGGLGTIIGTLANPMTAFALAATTAGAALAGSVGAAASWQSAMANVSKTTGLGGQDIQNLSSQLLTMSTSMPTAASELANIAQVAGSLGVAKENIAGFTEVAAQMAVGFEMPADVAATSAAKILTAYSKPIDATNMRALGNAVNALGDSTAATEPQIMDFVNRASFLSTTFNQSIPQVAALGATLISAGMEADTAATGIKSLLNIGLSESAKGKGLNAISELMGTSNEAMKQAFGQDLQGTLSQVADKLATIEDPVQRFNTAVAIAGTEGATALLKLAGQATNLKTNLNSANSEWTNGSSLMKTYEAQTATLDSQMQIFWNTVNKAGVELGTVLIPALTDVVQMMTSGVQAATGFGEAISGMYSNFQNTTLKDADNWFLGMMGISTSSGSEAAQNFVLDSTKMISDSYEDFNGAMTNAMVPAAKDAGGEAGKTAAETFAESNEKWIKANSYKFNEGYYDAMKNIGNGGEASGQGPDTSATSGRASIQTIRPDDARYYFDIVPNMVKTGAATFQDGIKIYKKGTDELIGTYDDIYKALLPLTDIVKKSQLAIPKEVIPHIVDQTNIDELVKLEEEFSKAGDMSRANYVDHLLAGDWGYDKLMTEGEKLGIYLKDSFEKPIANSGEWVKSELGKIAEDASNSWKNGLTQKEADAILAFEPELEYMRKNFPDEFNKSGGLSMLALIDALKKHGGNVEAVMADIGKIAGESFKKNLVGGAAIELPSLAEMVKDPSLIMKNFENIDKFVKNYLIPQLSQDMDNAKKLIASGVDENKIYDAYIRPLKSITDYMPTWLNQLMDMFEKGKLNLDQFLYVYEGMTGKLDKTTEKLKDQTVGYDQLAKSVQDCADCATSAFGDWQESQKDLFQDSYIGAGGQGYLDWKNQQMAEIAATQRAMQSVGGAVLGQDYTQRTPIVQDVQVNLQDEAARAGIVNIENEIANAGNNPVKISADISAAIGALENLMDQAASLSITIPVHFDPYYDEIAGIVQQVVSAALS